MKPSSEYSLRPIHLLAATALGLLLTACVGGGGGDTTSYTVSTSAGANGAISPTSATVAEGGTTSFTVTPDSGYQIEGASGCGGGLSGTAYTTGSITADCTVSATFAALPTITIANTSVVEGDSGATSLTFIVSLSEPANDDVTVDYVTTDGSAGAGSDYAAASGTLTINSGTTSNNISVTVYGDTTAEADETLTLTLSNVSANAALGTAVATGDILNDDLPSVSVADTSVLEGDSGATSLTFTVSLNAQANGDVTVDYATTDGSAGVGSDYAAASGTLTINSGTTSNTISVTVNGDTTPEANETLTLTLSNVSANAILGGAVATGGILNDDATGALNDTGITLCGDFAYGGGSGNHQNNLDCATVGATTTADGTDTDSDPVPAGQDALYGRDATSNDDSDGRAGFFFTKIDSAGNPLAADAASWDCVLDNVTGLMWEVKTTDGGLRDANHTYTWYNADSATNGGDAGTQNGGGCHDTINCDTEKYVAQVKGSALCGYTDWRMPNQEELLSIADMSTASPAIDAAYFPNTKSWWYWSSSPNASVTSGAWILSFNGGNYNWDNKVEIHYVRLVRGGQ